MFGNLPGINPFARNTLGTGGLFAPNPLQNSLLTNN
jgi:hypothetical protein